MKSGGNLPMLLAGLLVIVVFVALIVLLVLGMRRKKQEMRAPTTSEPVKAAVALAQAGVPSSMVRSVHGNVPITPGMLHELHNIPAHPLQTLDKMSPTGAVNIQRSPTNAIDVSAVLLSPDAKAAAQLMDKPPKLYVAKQKVATGQSITLATEGATVARMDNKLARIGVCTQDAQNMGKPIRVVPFARFDVDEMYRVDNNAPMDPTVDHDMWQAKLTKTLEAMPCTTGTYLLDAVAEHPQVFRLSSADRTVRLYVVDGELMGFCAPTAYAKPESPQDMIHAEEQLVKLIDGRFSGGRVRSFFWIDAGNHVRVMVTSDAPRWDARINPHFDPYLVEADGAFRIAMASRISNLEIPPAGALMYVDGTIMPQKQGEVDYKLGKAIEHNAAVCVN